MEEKVNKDFFIVIRSCVKGLIVQFLGVGCILGGDHLYAREWASGHQAALTFLLPLCVELDLVLNTNVGSNYFLFSKE